MVQLGVNRSWVRIQTGTSGAYWNGPIWMTLCQGPPIKDKEAFPVDQKKFDFSLRQRQKNFRSHQLPDVKSKASKKYSENFVFAFGWQKNRLFLPRLSGNIPAGGHGAAHQKPKSCVRQDTVKVSVCKHEYFSCNVCQSNYYTTSRIFNTVPEKCFTTENREHWARRI